ncbi:uncharacterized protein E0L32_000551 [Thyridium curvatum]|uniref:Uncharacterized protein n=1 Tax=Thyridium curvatum TaxID=1093900 RepID=A0A507B333_9PEZI|nr:uncharacterized protein E0L32_000551 [Thyridium curvatum]TPX14157.1 hypothetical protein E0L32_000551 [Thyridium curvatum]
MGSCLSVSLNESEMAQSPSRTSRSSSENGPEQVEMSAMAGARREAANSSGCMPADGGSSSRAGSSWSGETALTAVEEAEYANSYSTIELGDPPRFVEHLPESPKLGGSASFKFLGSTPARHRAGEQIDYAPSLERELERVAFLRKLCDWDDRFLSPEEVERSKRLQEESERFMDGHFRSRPLGWNDRFLQIFCCVDPYDRAAHPMFDPEFCAREEARERRAEERRRKKEERRREKEERRRGRE